MTETIPAIFARQAASLSAKTLFLAKQGGSYRPITWEKAAKDVRTLGMFLLKQGVNAADRIFLISENRPEWGISDMAIQSIGAWTVPIYPTLTGDDLRSICNDARPVACIASSLEQAEKCLVICKGVLSIRTIVVMDPLAKSLAGVMGSLKDADGQIHELSSILHDEASEEPELLKRFEQRLLQIGEEDTATLIYTSGTTGDPKGVMLSHKNFLSNVKACLQALPIVESDLHLSFLPLSHVFERMAGWYLMVYAGGCVAFAENMDTVAQNMAEVCPTLMLGVPRFFEKLDSRIHEAIQKAPPSKRRLIQWALGAGRQWAEKRLAREPISPMVALRHALADRLVLSKVRARLGGRLRFIVSGSAPLSAEIGRFLYSVGVIVIEGYGLTETSPVISVNRLPVPRFGSVGKLIPGVEVRIADDGEILTRGEHIMRGYYNKPEATQAVIVDGWFHTGDIGRLDSEGFLFITDRKKDLIKTAGGKFVAPQKLENLFTTDPYVSQVFVCGDRRPYCVALIVPDAERLCQYAKEQGITFNSIRELVAEKRVQGFYWDRIRAKQQGLARFEQVKKIALLDEGFSQAAGELTPTLKARRAIIAKRYAHLLECLYHDPAA